MNRKNGYFYPKNLQQDEICFHEAKSIKVFFFSCDQCNYFSLIKPSNLLFSYPKESKLESSFLHNQFPFIIILNEITIESFLASIRTLENPISSIATFPLLLYKDRPISCIHSFLTCFSLHILILQSLLANTSFSILFL